MDFLKMIGIGFLTIVGVALAVGFVMGLGWLIFTFLPVWLLKILGIIALTIFGSIIVGSIVTDNF